jgi:hypothetical protein
VQGKVDIQKRIKAYYANHKNELHIASGSMAAVVIIGSLLIFTKAAGFFAATEAESGTKSTQAVQVADTSASGGQAVKFTAPTGGGGSCPVAGSNVAGANDPWGGCWPGPGNTGVPAGTTLSTYDDSGACHLSTANATYDAKTFNCDLVIEATGIKITRSNIIGRIVSNEDSGTSVTISDSKIDGGQQETFPTVAYNNITLIRVEVIGGQHSIQCGANCTVTDTWAHNQYLPSSSAGHVNAFISNGGSGFFLTHNTLHCTVLPTDGGGCTADASLFGDFSPISDAHFDKNLFIDRNDGAGYCLQAGWNPGKAYPTPSNVSVTNNIFKKGANGHCGIYGVYTAYYNGNGDVFSGNKFDDGTPVN